MLYCVSRSIFCPGDTRTGLFFGVFFLILHSRGNHRIQEPVFMFVDGWIGTIYAVRALANPLSCYAAHTAHAAEVISVLRELKGLQNSTGKCSVYVVCFFLSGSY